MLHRHRRELEATGVSFAANALVPWLWQRGQALTDELAGVPPPLLAAMLVGLALVVAYLPGSLLVLLKARARTLTLGSALAVVLTSAACAGVLEPKIAGGAVQWPRCGRFAPHSYRPRTARWPSTRRRRRGPPRLSSIDGSRYAPRHRPRAQAESMSRAPPHSTDLWSTATRR